MPTSRDPLARSLGRIRMREQRDEDRHGRVRDRGDAGVDVLLAPGDEPERQRPVDDAEHDGVPTHGAAGRPTSVVFRPAR